MFGAHDKHTTIPAGQPQLDPFAIAAGLFRNDLPILAPVALIIILSALMLGSASPHGLLEEFALMSFDRVMQVGVVSFLVLRWRRKLEHSRAKMVSLPTAVYRIFVGGLIVWVALTLPAQGILFSGMPEVAPLFFFLFVIAIFWSFRCYFYFALFGLLGGTFRDVFRATLTLGRLYPMAAVRSLIAPIAYTSLGVAALSMPSPDGRSQFWATASLAGEGIFLLLATYTGLAFALVLIQDSDWRSSGLDPYRTERLRTLEAQGRASRFNLLAPRHGIRVFCISLCIVVSNLVQAHTLAPAAQIKVASCEAGDHILRVVLEVVDVEYNLRGFNPYAFSIASQTGFPVSTKIAKVSLSPDGPEVSSSLPKGPEPIKLYYEFRTNKTQEALTSMDNLWLWYNLKAIEGVQAK